MTRYTYSSNNSGGSWWLDDNDWFALEKAGWTVDWAKDRKSGFMSDGSERWLGALATSASKKFASYEDAVAEWQQVIGQDIEDEGCECCGPPHYIY